MSEEVAPMYILLGHPRDPCCVSLQAALNARGRSARIIPNLFAHPARLSWRLDTDRCVSQVAWDDGPSVPDDEIEGVLVRDIGSVNPAGWQPNDLTYVQAETQAALLGWLWSLRCPVVNRYSAATWYRPQLSLLSWRPLLWRCGLPALEALVTNVEEEARAFRWRIATEEATGVVYRPLTSHVSYRVADDRDWNGLAAMQRHAPVCLTGPCTQPQSACIVGEQVIWDGAPPRQAETLEPALLRFAASASLTFVEVVLAEVANGLCVVSVEHHPNYERFGDAAQQAIIAGLIECVTAGEPGAAAPRPVGARVRARP